MLNTWLNIKRILQVVAFLNTPLFLYSCTAEEVKPSLADIDVTQTKKAENNVFIKAKSELEIRKAYSEYLNNSEIDDNSRINALSRLAELEFDYSNKLLQDREKLKNKNSVEVKDALYDAQLDKTITLLITAINDYPKATNNDTLLYQLQKPTTKKANTRNQLRL